MFDKFADQTCSGECMCTYHMQAWTFAMFSNMSIYDVITSHSQWRHFNTPTIIQRESGSGGPVIDHLLFLSETAANFEGLYIFRKNDYCLPHWPLIRLLGSKNLFMDMVFIRHYENMSPTCVVFWKLLLRGCAWSCHLAVSYTKHPSLYQQQNEENPAFRNNIKDVEKKISISPCFNRQRDKM